MELRHLRYFVILAQELHFGRAAEKLNISQPPLSTQIKHLESELGVSLFERNRRQVKLTDAGKVFLKSVRALLTDVEKTVMEVQAADRGELETLIIGYRSSITLKLTMPILVQFQRKYPNIRIKFEQGSVVEIYDGVVEHRVDLGIVAAPVSQLGQDQSYEDLEGITIIKLPLMIAVPLTHPLSGRTKVSLHEFAEDDFIFMRQLQVLSPHELWIGLCQQAGFSPKIKYQCEQMSEALIYVAAGYGITFAPRDIQDMWKDMVTFLPLEHPVYLTFSLIYRGANKSRAVQAFRQVSEEFANSSRSISDEVVK